MTFLVLGATGQQGGAVARALLSRGQPVRALTRKKDSPAARALANLGAMLVVGDLDRPETLEPAFAGAQSVFSVQDYYAPGVGLAGEIRQGRAVISAAKAAGVRLIVQSTMGDALKPGGPAHFLSKALLERDIRNSGLDWTLLGTVWFMDNLTNPAMKPHLMFPVLSGSLRPNTRFQMLAVDDLGWMAAEAMTNPGAWAGRKINLAGDTLTVAQMKAAYLEVTGQRPKAWSLPSALFRRLVPEFAAQLRWHNETGFSFDQTEFRAVHPAAQDFRGFLRKRGIVGM
ncbi:MAG: NmrA/HSCARG family protein [Rhodobacter sp.]|nr:NmrA/HSCARG family protein [Rhodobacter sp.]